MFSDATLDRLHHVFEGWLAGWDANARTVPPIEPGSSLAGDFLLFPRMGDLAWTATISAVDHLKAVRANWFKAGELHAFADATLIRAALLGASTAVCLLDDSFGVGRRERVRRGALAALVDHRDHLRHIEDMSQLIPSMDADAGPSFQKMTRIVEVWRDEATELARRMGATKEQLHWGLSATKCIEVGAKVAARRETVRARQHLSVGIQAVWQRGSADAHSRSWQTISRLSDGEEASMRADPEQLAGGVHSAALVLNQAFRLWDLRRINQVERLLVDDSFEILWPVLGKSMSDDQTGQCSGDGPARA